MVMSERRCFRDWIFRVITVRDDLSVSRSEDDLHMEESDEGPGVQKIGLEDLMKMSSCKNFGAIGSSVQ